MNGDGNEVRDPDGRFAGQRYQKLQKYVGNSYDAAAKKAVGNGVNALRQLSNALIFVTVVEIVNKHNLV